MPIYGHNKVRTMVRSILPSTARRSAKKDKDHVHRSNRRASTHRLAHYKGPQSYVIDEFEDSNYDFEFWTEIKDFGYGEIIYDRRAHDKLAHFEMWAYQRTKHLRPEDRLSKMRGLLPPGVIGEHALSHLDFLEPPNYEAPLWRRNFDEAMLPRRLHTSYSGHWRRQNKERWTRWLEALRPIAEDPHKLRELNHFVIRKAKSWQNWYWMPAEERASVPQLRDVKHLNDFIKALWHYNRRYYNEKFLSDHVAERLGIEK